jgi:peptidoglycan hydrolase-like protein with peptidoglycan-binding domain
MHFAHRYTSIVIAASMLVPSGVASQAVAVPYQQNFILTAYYSPLPDQCCYIKGSYEADKVLNGEGTHAADGTPVYEGMLAAPPTYAFGTRIKLPGLGVLTVHDRGGAIQEWDDAHRLDVWAGSGEEGLARALAFGVQHIIGTVYPVGSDAPEPSATVATLPAPIDRLKPYIVSSAGITSMKAMFGQRGLTVRNLQESLAELGYFDHEITGMYGDVTKSSLAAFLSDMQLNEPADKVTDNTAVYLEAAKRVWNAESPIDFVNEGSSAADIKTAQRTLRYLGFYKGRTDGEYSDVLVGAIIAYQKDKQLVADALSPGAGKIGPLTKGTLDKELARKRVAREVAKIAAFNRVRELLAERNTIVNSTMQEGSNGKIVRALQTFLAQKGFFPKDKVNGNFGALTASSVAKYQIARGLLSSEKEKGAGTVGPITLKTINDEQIKNAYRLVREKGWGAI